MIATTYKCDLQKGRKGRIYFMLALFSCFTVMWLVSYRTFNDNLILHWSLALWASKVHQRSDIFTIIWLKWLSIGLVICSDITEATQWALQASRSFYSPFLSISWWLTYSKVVHDLCHIPSQDSIRDSPIILLFFSIRHRQQDWGRGTACLKGKKEVQSFFTSKL